jgi:hypothetical protein
MFVCAWGTQTKFTNNPCFLFFNNRQYRIAGMQCAFFACPSAPLWKQRRARYGNNILREK